MLLMRNDRYLPLTGSLTAARYLPYLLKKNIGNFFKYFMKFFGKFF